MILANLAWSKVDTVLLLLLLLLLVLLSPAWCCALGLAARVGPSGGLLLFCTRALSSLDGAHSHCRNFCLKTSSIT
jgi:hypothetical protein